MSCLMLLAATLSVALAADPAPLPPGPVVDRTGPPPVAAPEVLTLDEPEVHALTEAATVHYVRVPGVRKVEVQIRPRRGQLAVVGEAGLEGRAVGWLADAATAGHSAPELSTLEDLHSIDVATTMSLHDGRVELRAPLNELPVGLQLLSEVVRSASFPKTETRRWILDQYQYFGITGPSSPRQVADSAMAYAWFPASHPYGARPDPGVLADLSPRVLRDHYRRWLAEAPLHVLVVGDVAYEEVAPALAQMLEGLGTPGGPEPELEVPAPPSRIVAVDMPGQQQVSLRLRTSAPPRHHAERTPMEAANYVLGGHFLSRLNRNLREDKGWTYGARSRYHVSDHAGMLTVSVDVGSDHVADAVHEIEAELQHLVDAGASAGELQLAYRRLVADWNGTRGTAEDAASRYGEALEVGQTLAEQRAMYVGLGELSADDVRDVAGQWLGADAPRVWVVVGDRAALEPQLAELGWSAEWLSPQQAILGRF